MKLKYKLSGITYYHVNPENFLYYNFSKFSVRNGWIKDEWNGIFLIWTKFEKIFENNLSGIKITER